MKLKKNLSITFLAVSLIPLILIFIIMFNAVSNILQEEIINEHYKELEERDRQVHELLDQHISLVLLLKDLPPVQGIIRSQPTGIDPLDGSSLKEWNERFEIIFTRMIEVQEDLDHIRFINEEGKEIIRVQRTDNAIKTVLEDKLQNKSEKEYFKSAMQLKEDEVYISQINLNQEDGKIEYPHKPVIRYATPVFDKEGKRKGIMIINVQADKVLDFFSKTTKGSSIITDEEGNFLSHKNKEKLFGNELQTGYNYFKEQPELEKNIINADFKNYHDEEEQEYRIWRKIYYNRGTKEKYWIIFNVIEEQEMFLPLEKLKRMIILLAIITAILVSLLSTIIANRIANPIKNLTEVIEQISKGNLEIQINQKLKEKKSEIGNLARAFDRTLISLKLAMLRTGLTKEYLALGVSKKTNDKEKLEQEDYSSKQEDIRKKEKNNENKKQKLTKKVSRKKKRREKK